MDIRQFSVKDTARLALLDASGKPMKNKEGAELAVNLYGPSSKQFAKARNVQNNRVVEKLKVKGSADQTIEQDVSEVAEFLAACTESFENLEYDTLKGDALAKAVYSDAGIGFIPEQVNKFIGVWANFLPPSTKS